MCFVERNTETSLGLTPRYLMLSYARKEIYLPFSPPSYSSVQPTITVLSDPVDASVTNLFVVSRESDSPLTLGISPARYHLLCVSVTCLKTYA